MSITRTKIINDIIFKYKIKTYLEIGVRDSRENFNLVNVDPENKIGVDPDPITPVKYRMKSDEYFKLNQENNKFDMVFVDGLHTYEQAYLDVIHSLYCLNDNGFIIMHDCNPPTEYHIRSYEDYLKTRGQWNGNVYRAFIRLKHELKDYNCFVVDEDFGCGIITKNKLSKTFNSDFNFDSLTAIDYDISWNDFIKNKKDLLNLVTYDEFIKII